MLGMQKNQWFNHLLCKVIHSHKANIMRSALPFNEKQLRTTIVSGGGTSLNALFS